MAREPGFAATVDRVVGSLAAAPAEQPQAWEPLPRRAWTAILPADIKSCWIFVLRAKLIFGAERHPNSHQRTVALRGDAAFELFQDQKWIPHPIRPAGTDPSSGSWISIPANTWHRIQIGPEGLVSCSLHTVPAEELIEETPVAGDLMVTHSRLYQAE